MHALAANACICAHCSDSGLQRRLSAAGVRLADFHFLERVGPDQFVGDRILGHRRQGTEDVPGAARGSALLAEHVIDELKRVPAAQLGERRVPERPAFDPDIEHGPDTSPVGAVSPIRPRQAVRPGTAVVPAVLFSPAKIRADGVAPNWSAVGAVERILRLALGDERARRAPSAVRSGGARSTPVCRKGSRELSASLDAGQRDPPRSDAHHAARCLLRAR